MMFRVSFVRKLLNVPGVSRKPLSDNSRTLVLKSVQRFSGWSESSGLYWWAMLSSRRRRTFSRSWLDGAEYVVGPGKVGAPKDSAVLDKSPSTAYIVDLFPSLMAIGIPSTTGQIRPLEPRSSYPQFPSFYKVKEHWEAFISWSRAVKNNAWLIDIPVSAIGYIKITPDDPCIPLGSRVRHRSWASLSTLSRWWDPPR